MVDIETLNFGDWPVDERYLVELGRMAIVWGKLEVFVQNSVANFAGLENLEDNKLYTVFSANSYDDNVALIEKLCALQLSAEPNIKNYPQVLEQLKRSQQLKLRFLNGSIRPNPANNDVEIIVADDAEVATLKVETITVTDLKKAVLAIDQAQYELYKLVCALERPSRKV
jgi:hypothetical protein